MYFFYIKTSSTILAETQLFSAGLEQPAAVCSCAKQLAAARGQQPPPAPPVNPTLLRMGRVVQPAETPEQSAWVLRVLFLNTIAATVKHQVKGML